MRRLADDGRLSLTKSTDIPGMGKLTQKLYAYRAQSLISLPSCSSFVFPYPHCHPFIVSLIVIVFTHEVRKLYADVIQPCTIELWSWLVDVYRGFNAISISTNKPGNR